MSTPLTPVGNIYPSSKIQVLASNACTFNNIQATAYLTGSVADCSGYLYKTIMAYLVTGAAVSSGNTPNFLHVGISYDNLTWNYINIQSGAFNALGEWFYQSFNYPIPYIRGMLYNATGSKASGSIAVLGYKE